MGEVYRADDLKLEQPVALKFLPKGLELKQSLLAALYNEVRQARKVSHRHVCRVYDVGEAEGRHFLSMEYIEGEDLGSLLRRIGRLPRDKALELARQLCRGLQAAHDEGLLHLDLKPANLMIDGRGDLRVTDFGLARLAGDAEAEKRRAGTPAYMAPEQIAEGVANRRSDLYAVGLVLYEMLVGERLCRGATLDEIAAFHRGGGAARVVEEKETEKVDPGLWGIVRRCLAPDPEGRPESLDEVLGELGALVEHSAELSATARRPVGDPVDPVEAISASDVYLAYAPIDDEPLAEGKPGWVSQFHRNLEVRTQQLLGEKVSVWRPSKSLDHEEVEEVVLEHLADVKAMVSVVSPPFAHSDACLREVAAFRDRLGPLFRVDGQPRLLPAVKTPIESRELTGRSSAFEGLRGFEFYEKDPLTGHVREFEEAFGEEARQRYYERVYDLAFNLCNVLKACRQAAGSTAERAGADASSTIFLSATTSDLAVHHDRLRRELSELGLHVVPDRPLATHRADLEREVCELLKTCDCIVQIVGPTYGIVPENARQSLLELQNGWAAERARQAGVPRFIWMPHGMAVEDERQRAFVERLREVDAGEPTTELLEGTLNAFRDRLVRRLRPAEDTGDGDGESAADGRAAGRSDGGPPLLYLICDQRDEEAVEGLEDYLFEQGIQVVLPEFSADQEEVAAAHREQLVECDAVMIYYGAARKAWVDIKLRDVVKAVGYGREGPVAYQAVFVAPPEDRRKERFKAHAADVIRQGGMSVRDSDGMGAFVEKVLGPAGGNEKGGCGG
jgi:serine/threonine protein kinase